MDSIKKNGYLSADSIWEAFRIKSFDEFFEKTVVRGKFHKNVPEDVIKEYKTVEYLLAHSYFYYPMLDIALLKAGVIFEMAVKMRCNQLEIEIPKKDDREPTLNTYLKELSKFSNPGLISEWHKVKKIRNLLAHPKQSTLWGSIVLNSFYQIINILNKLFLSSESYNDLLSPSILLKEKSELFKKGLFILEYNENKYLIYSAFPYSGCKNGAKVISYWCFYPVLKNFPQKLDEISITSPICLYLKDVNVLKNNMTGNIINNNEIIKLYPTDNSDNLQTYSTFKAQVATADPGVLDMYNQLLDEEISKGIIRFMYDEFW
jgi:hypothetical protein